MCQICCHVSGVANLLRHLPRQDAATDSWIEPCTHLEIIKLLLTLACMSCWVHDNDTDKLGHLLCQLHTKQNGRVSAMRAAETYKVNLRTWLLGGSATETVRVRPAPEPTGVTVTAGPSGDRNAVTSLVMVACSMAEDAVCARPKLR